MRHAIGAQKNVTTIHEIINHWSSLLGGDPALARGLDATFTLTVVGVERGVWQIRGRPPYGVVEGRHDESGCELEIDSHDLLEIMNGRLNPQAAFLQGKIKLMGDSSLALRLYPLLETRNL